MTNSVKNKIKLDVCVITETSVNVAGSSTSYGNKQLAQKVNIANLKPKVQELAKLAKANKCKVVGKNKALAFIREHLNTYNSQYEGYFNLFKHYRALVIAKVEKGIYAPTIDDQELNTIYQVRDDISRLWYRSEDLHKVHEFNEQIDDLLERFKSDSCSLSMINIGCV